MTLEYDTITKQLKQNKTERYLNTHQVSWKQEHLFLEKEKPFFSGPYPQDWILSKYSTLWYHHNSISTYEWSRGHVKTTKVGTSQDVIDAGKY